MNYAELPRNIEPIARNIVDAGFYVHSTLGPGLLESAYEHCSAYELETRGCAVRRQVALPIVYGTMKSDAGYRIDILVAGSILVEVKSVEALAPVHQAQLLTYLKLSGCRLGFLVNFNVPLFKQGSKRMAL
ncbi:GxxExxY protein [Methylosinus sp. Ce-a6]|uniref:GxxExxY protein n=1 Tax=Methylosinus sp. Ce-a6 TaxID=2172005 RepID=UPI00191555DA|nr:GxxExxY protein [Methylosinus sp. Ce-a6]